MGKCNLTNESFFTTNDTNSIVIAEESDMYRLESPCKGCLKEVREACKQKLISLITGKELNETPDVKTFINKYKQDDGNNTQDRHEEGRAKHSKRRNR